MASLITLLSQFLAHWLSLHRDRRDHRRNRLADAVINAAHALMRVNEPDEYEAPETDSRDAQGLTAESLLPFMERTTAAMTVLSIHFGRGHWLVEEYAEISAMTATTLGAVERVHGRVRGEEYSQDEISSLVEQLVTASENARDWVERALAEVERI